MADRHLEAATVALASEGMFDTVLAPDGAYSAIQREPEDIVRIAVTAYLDSVLGALPLEARQAAGAAIHHADGDWLDSGLTAFLQSLRDSLVSGRDA